MKNLGLAVLAAFFFGAYNAFIKAASSHIHQVVGAVVLQVVAALLGIGLLLFLKVRQTPLEVTVQGFWLAAGAGLMVGLAEIASFYLFSRGMTASLGIPIIIGGSVFFGVLLGLIFLKESLSPIRFFGLFLIILGVILLTAKTG